MVGRTMLGKITYRVGECLGGRQTCGGKDVMLSGDPKQAAPIGDDSMFMTGPYRGKGLNKPRNSDAETGARTVASFSNDGQLFREEFEDVVILRRVHRIDETGGCADPIAAAAYKDDADRFLEVTNGMANCTWTLQDHA